MNIQNRCMRCYEPITNPVCVKCHLEEIRFFLKDYDVDRRIVNLIVDDIKKYIRNAVLVALQIKKSDILNQTLIHVFEVGSVHDNKSHRKNQSYNSPHTKSN